MHSGSIISNTPLYMIEIYMIENGFIEYNNSNTGN